MKKLKKDIPLKYLYLLLVFVVMLVILGLYKTYALFTAEVESGVALSMTTDITYDLNINGTQNFSVGSNSSIVFNANVKNDTSKTKRYQLYYSSSDDLSDVIVAEVAEDKFEYEVQEDTDDSWEVLPNGIYMMPYPADRDYSYLTITFELTETSYFSFEYCLSGYTNNYIYHTITNSEGTVIDNTGDVFANRQGGLSNAGTSDDAEDNPFRIRTHLLPAGSYTVVFTYVKETREHEGITNAAYVRNIVFSNRVVDGELASGENVTVPIVIVNNSSKPVDITIGVVKGEPGYKIVYGEVKNFPNGIKITKVYKRSDINVSENLVCVNKTVDGVSKTYCKVKDIKDIMISSNIGTFSHGLYNVTTNCDNADSTFLDKTREFAISNLNGETICEAIYTPDNTGYTTLYQQIINDWNGTNGTKNIYKEDHTLESGSTYSEYRYEGNDLEVENYVWFNNELWRIIGAFPGGTPSTMSGTTFVQGNAAPSTNNTVKIIRNEAIGGFAWDNNNINNWTTAELNTNVLNNLYLNSSSGTCNFYSTTVAKACSFSENGLKNVQDYLEDVTWNLGGWDTASVYTTDMYNYERGTTICSGCSYPYITTAKVGLMYPSDYGYASASDTCQSETNLFYYDSCGKDGWLLKYGYEWTQSLHSGYTYTVFYVSDAARLNPNSVNIGLTARPVVYLKSNIYVTGGDGSINNPYQIAIG